MRLVDGPGPGIVEVTVWSLEMTSPADLVPAAMPGDPSVELLRAGRAAPELSAFFYREVGADWHWVDRADWSRADWLRWVDRDEHHLLWIVSEGAPAGYLELEQQAGGAVEIAYFGLMPGCLGRGLGPWLLAEGIAAAWALPGTQRVWVHTCSLDSPAARRTYEARGLRVFAESREFRRPE